MAYNDEDNSFLTNNMTSCVTHVKVANDALNDFFFKFENVKTSDKCDYCIYRFNSIIINLYLLFLLNLVCVEL